MSWAASLHLPRPWANILWVILFAWIGAALAAPLWWSAWQGWQSHGARQAQWLQLQSEVEALALQPPLNTETNEPWTQREPPHIQSELRRLAQESDLQVPHLELGLPLLWPATPGWWRCPFDLRLKGASASWLLWWQKQTQTYPDSTMTRLQLDTLPDGTIQVDLGLQVACVLDGQTLALDSGDPFSLRDWQKLHNQQAQSHPSFQALAQRWLQPRAPLEQFSLQQMHYVGHVFDASQHMAVLQVQVSAHEVQTHSVFVGQALGAHLGRVAHIDEQAVTVDEWLRDDAGVWRKHRVRLAFEAEQP